MTLAEILMFKYPDQMRNFQIIVQDDGQGQYIAKWQMGSIPKPNEADLLNDQNTQVEIALNNAISLLDVLVDEQAKSLGYDSSITICTYVNSTNEKWSAEANAFIAWRDAVWSKALEVKDDVVAGKREMPSLAQFKNELPKIQGA